MSAGSRPKISMDHPALFSDLDPAVRKLVKITGS